MGIGWLEPFQNPLEAVEMRVVDIPISSLQEQIAVPPLKRKDVTSGPSPSRLSSGFIVEFNKFQEVLQ
jgi:hypothetical protein